MEERNLFVFCVEYAIIFSSKEQTCHNVSPAVKVYFILVLL